MVGIVQICDGVSQRLDPSGWTVLPRCGRDFDRLWAREATRDVIIGFWSSLT